MIFKSQTALNLVTAAGAFAAGACVRFFTTPYVVARLGAEAYGFVGLSANILGVASLLTIALNSLAGRFISVEYARGDTNGAKSYYSSLIVANAVLGAVLAAVCTAVCAYLDRLVSIPPGLAGEIRILFGFLSANTVLSLLAGTWCVGSFIRNRMEVANGISIAGNMVQAAALFALFGLGDAHIWYVGAAILAMGAFTAVASLAAMRRLVPDVRFDPRAFDLSRIATLVRSGSWNLVSRLSDILGQGLDLLVANLFLGAALTGSLAISKNVPFVLLGFFAAIAASFNPMLVKRYAERSHSQFTIVLGRAMEICGFAAAPALVCLFAFGRDFYSLWVPGEDASLLQTLTLLGAANMVFAMPLESLWSVFTAVNRLKWPTLFMLCNSLLVFGTMIAGCLFLESPLHRLMVVAGSRAGWGILRSLTFLPLYGARAVSVPYPAFYVPVAKTAASFAIGLSAALLIRNSFAVDSWLRLAAACAAAAAATCAAGAAVWRWRALRRILPVVRFRRRMIHFVHRADPLNAGDAASCPAKYFRWPLPVAVHDIENIDLRLFRKNDIAIIGGGGLVDCSEAWNATINEIASRCGKSIVWGAGFNKTDGGKVNVPVDFGRFSIVAIRDAGHPSGFEWLPCASCMAIGDSLADVAGSGTGAVWHKDGSMPYDGDSILNSLSPARVVRFISRHAAITTNSYHAAYWAGLLGKNVSVECADGLEKFSFLRATSLAQAKEMNRQFYGRVLKEISG